MNGLSGEPLRHGGRQGNGNGRWPGRQGGQVGRPTRHLGIPHLTCPGNILGSGLCAKTARSGE